MFQDWFDDQFGPSGIDVAPAQSMFDSAALRAAPAEPATKSK
jgi:hypothetical protein